MRDDLPSAPGLLDAGPFGSIAHHEGKTFRIPCSVARFDPGQPEAIDDAGALLDAARFVEGSFVLTGHHTHLAQRERMTAWVEAALGPARDRRTLGPLESIAWLEDAVFLTLKGAFVIGFGSLDRVRALLTHPLSEGRSLAPARWSYEGIGSFPAPSALLGTITHPIWPLVATHDLHETAEGCLLEERLGDRLRARYLVKRGGLIATAPSAAALPAQAIAFGEEQPGWRSPSDLQALLGAHGASDALVRAVLHADERTSGFRGARGIEALAPWAASLLQRAAGPGIWASPVHPEIGGWILGWAHIAQVRSTLYLDEAGGVRASWQDAGDDEVQVRLLDDDMERWFHRQIFLLENGYASEATCRDVSALPSGVSLREDLSCATAKVHVGSDRDGPAVWLEEERGVQRMSRSVRDVADVLSIARGQGLGRA